MHNQEPTSRPSKTAMETGLILGIVVVVVCAGMPWFIEQKMIRDVRRSHHHCSEILRSLTSYRADNGFIPDSICRLTFSVLLGEPIEDPSREPLAFLTTPQAYLPEVPKAPFDFRSRNIPCFLSAAVNPDQPDGLIAVLCSGPGGPPAPRPVLSDDPAAALWKVENDSVLPRQDIWYAPTNGMLSTGWIYRDSARNASPGGEWFTSMKSARSPVDLG
ncbi:MAG: hypothetical protein ABIH23_09720 [bacterium]